MSLVHALSSEGLHVQLKHVSKETSWEETDVHGYVALRLPNGTELVRRGGFQHNRKLRNGGAFDTKAVQQLVDIVKKAETSGAFEGVAPEKAEQQPSFFGRMLRRMSGSTGAPAAASA